MPKPYIPNDKWSRKAAAEGYRARSAYKLMELDERFRLLQPGMMVLDFGAAPGSWLQYVSKKIGPRGMVIGFDLTHIEPVAENVITYKVDITDRAKVAEILRRHEVEKADLVLSDIAPSTSGIKDIDQWRSIELTDAVLETARDFLKPGGRCAVKIFRGADFDEFLGKVRQHWKNIRLAKVEASRDRSKEVYMVMTR